MVVHIKSKEEFLEIIQREKLVVVDFTASWCGPCKKIGPQFDNLSDAPANKMVVFLKVDVDMLPDVAEMYGISAMPTFLFFKDGKKVDSLVGANEKGLEEKINAFRNL